MGWMIEKMSGLYIVCNNSQHYDQTYIKPCRKDDLLFAHYNHLQKDKI